MLHVLKRHPLPIRAWFDHCLVLTYAFPEATLAPLAPDGLVIDTWNGLGFLAAAMVQTRNLRPVGLPAVCGRSFFLAGYRVFVKHRTREGRTLRGLRIIRSDADHRLMVMGGNLLTHYNYRLCRADITADEQALSVSVRTPGAVADVEVVADLRAGSGGLPPGSPFESARDARRFAGPMPYTFDYERQTRSIVRIKGVREAWDPRLVKVEVRKLTFLERGELGVHRGVLASAFHVAQIPYRWERGVLEPLEGAAA